MTNLRRIQKKAIRSGLNPQEIYSLKTQDEVIKKMRDKQQEQLKEEQLEEEQLEKE